MPEPKIDVEFCLILIDKLSNPNLTDAETTSLLKELIDCARYDLSYNNINRLVSF